MTGMEMMLKSLGIDPDKIKAELLETLKDVTLTVMQQVDELKASQLRIEAKLDALIKAHGLVGIGGQLDTVPESEFDGGYDRGTDSGN